MSTRKPVLCWIVFLSRLGFFSCFGHSVKLGCNAWTNRQSSQGENRPDTCSILLSLLGRSTVNGRWWQRALRVRQRARP